MKELLCFVHPNSALEFPPGYWNDVERVDDRFCPLDYCQWMTRESYEQLGSMFNMNPGALRYPRAFWREP